MLLLSVRIVTLTAPVVLGSKRIGGAVALRHSTIAITSGGLACNIACISLCENIDGSLVCLAHTVLTVTGLLLGIRVVTWLTLLLCVRVVLSLTSRYEWRRIGLE